MHVEAIFPGSFYISDGEHAMLAGCPPEIVKVLLREKLQPPQYLLLPDEPVSRGECQVAVEFPLYYHLFFHGDKRPAGPLNLVGNARRVKAAAELLELSLFGPSEAQMEACGIPGAKAAALARETRWFQMKDPAGKAISFEALVARTVLGDEAEDLGWLRIRRVSSNVFSLESPSGETTQIDLTPKTDQAPPYPVPGDLVPAKLVKLGVEILGGATGFTATQPSCGLAICFNGQYLLVDAIPYLTHHMRARGISRNQVRALFLSHIHDDHCNLISFLLYNRRIAVLTTPLIYHMMLRKLSLTLDRSEESLQEYFDFIPLTPGEETNFFGLRITPHYSSHSIPTVGAKFETAHDGVDYRIAFTGDTQSLADLRRMQRTGVITQDRFLEVAAPYRQPAQLLIADGGEGQIHGDPSDALESPAERIVFLHTEKLSDAFDAHFTTAAAGKRFGLLPGATDYYLTRTIEFLLEYFPEMPPMWISNLLANQRVIEYNAGDVIIREGAQSDGRVYMLLTGHASVVHHDGGRKMQLAQMEAGEIIGEMSIIMGQGVRNASVVAQSPVIATAFSEAAFHEYVHHQNLESRLKRLWQHRELLQSLPYLRPLQQPVIRDLARHVALENLAARTGPQPLKSFCDPHSLILPLGVELNVTRDGATETIPAHSAPILCVPGVNLVSEAEFEYLRLGADDSAELRRRIPAFRYLWEEILGLPLPHRVRF
jgi:Cyclic nucleotide-binding domain/Metallo-beta-lactamase superfamily